jgi:hypothetical protein
VVRRPEHRSRGTAASLLFACAPIGLLVGCACSAPATSPAPAAAARAPEEPPPPPPPPVAAASPAPAEEVPRTEHATKTKAKKAAPVGAEAPAPQLFPWPPPSPTARVAIDLSKVSPSAGGRTFGDIDGFLGAALSGAGYRDRAWYSVPGGFALVTRLEQVGDDGSPRPGDARWSTVPRFGSFSLRDYLRALLQATPGHFRVIAFVVTDQDFDSTPKPMTEELASEWAESGAPRLPASIAARPAGDRVFSVALIYEFARHRYDEQAEFLKGGDVPGADQLRRSGLAAVVLP